MTVWTSVLWKTNIQLAEKWPRIVVKWAFVIVIYLYWELMYQIITFIISKLLGVKNPWPDCFQIISIRVCLLAMNTVLSVAFVIVRHSTFRVEIVMRSTTRSEQHGGVGGKNKRAFWPWKSLSLQSHALVLPPHSPPPSPPPPSWPPSDRPRTTWTKEGCFARVDDFGTTMK